MKRIAPRWKWLLLLLLAAIAIGLAFYFDGALRTWVVNHPNRAAKNFMGNVSRFGDWPYHILAGLLLIALAYWRGSKQWVRLGLTMVLACALAGIAARGVKIATGRARPSVTREAGWHGLELRAKYNSFPSGHTAATTGFFGVLLFARRRLGLCLLPIPLLIAASRIYVAAHYLSDVVCAAVLGIFCAWLCARLAQVSR
ncbi:MAG: phosphatase PAP2 family protein [Chthoniobacterales bacterium]|nr:phosphatase PAP2 family protein [Chthoniobacterales bacterium]